MTASPRKRRLSKPRSASRMNRSADHAAMLIDSVQNYAVLHELQQDAGSYFSGRQIATKYCVMTSPSLYKCKSPSIFSFLHK